MRKVDNSEYKVISILRVPKRFFGIRDFPSLKLGIRDFTAKSGRDSGLKVCAGGGMPKIALGITGLLEILGRDYGIEEPYWGPALIVDADTERCGYVASLDICVEITYFSR